MNTTQTFVGKTQAVGFFVSRSFSCLVALALLALLGGYSQAAVIVANYTFTSSSLASSDTEGDSGAGSITLGSGLSEPLTFNMGSPSTGSGIDTAVGNSAPSFAMSPGDLGTTFNANDYIAFTVTANSGYKLFLNNGSVTLQVGTDKAGLWAVRSSVDNFAANLGSGTGGVNMGNPTFSTSTVSLTGAGFDNISSVTFRLYGWDSLDMGMDSNDILWFDNIALNDLVAAVPVPEPVTVALGVFAGGLGVFQAARWRRRRKCSTQIG